MGNNHLVTGSFPASMSAWKKVAVFAVRENQLVGALPELNYGAMKGCDLLDINVAFPELFNHFSCPWPEGVTKKCKKFFINSMEPGPVTNADCHNTTASKECPPSNGSRWRTPPCVAPSC